MATFAIADYLTSLIPTLATVLPGYNTAPAIQGAMALYWSYMFPWFGPPIGPSTPGYTPNPGNPLDSSYLEESALSERQKWMIALRVAVSIIPAINGWFTSPQISEAGAGPALVKFQDFSKMMRVILPLWQTDLNNVEAAEGIFFNLLPNVPAYLLRLETSYPILGETNPRAPVEVIQGGILYLEGPDLG